MSTTAENKKDSGGGSGGLLSTLLKPFAEVHAGEAVGALMLTFTVFLLLTAYYLLKTAREPLILILHNGARVKSYASLGQSLLLIGVIRIYTSLARRVGRLKLLSIIYLFFISNLAIFAVLARAHVNIGIVFFLWVGIFNVTAIAQFWSFSNDIYTEDQGKRLFAIIGIGSSVGAVVGAKVAEALVHFGPYMLMIVAAVILGLCLGLIAIVDTRIDKQEGSPGKKKDEQPPVDAKTFQLLIHDKYLLLVGALTLMLNCVNKTGEYILDRALLASPAAHAPGVDTIAYIGAFKADYFSWINLIGVLLQLFAVSRIIKYLGVRGALFFLPIVAGVAYATTAILPILGIIRWAKIGENATDYSVQSTANQTLYLVTNRTEKYVGKTIIDTFIVRFGDVFSAGFVWLGAELTLGVRAFAIINLVLIGGWIVLVLAISRENKKRSDEGRDKKDGDEGDPKSDDARCVSNSDDDGAHHHSSEPAPA
ncbi:MAG: MFS transporter [Polyangiaceae bacterium]